MGAADPFAITSSWPVRTNFLSSFRGLIILSMLFCGFVVVRSAESRHHHRRTNNFVIVNYLPGGEVETRVRYNGISAKETSVSNRNNSGLMFRELTDGRRFIQLVYENGTLKDCDYGRRKEQIRSFLNVFDVNAPNVTVSTSSLVIEKLNDREPLPKNVRKWFNYPKLRKLCRRKKKHQRTKKKGKKENVEFELNFDRNRIWTTAATHKKHSLIVMPGTMWCGDQNVAPHYNALGLFAETDRCCRRHDFCRKNIDAYSRKYDFFNGKPFTISHCHCDASFRACLKMVGSSDADVVGKIFFNWVQTKCFVIKRKRICAEYEGKKCAKKQTVKRAVIKTNLPY